MGLALAAAVAFPCMAQGTATDSAVQRARRLASAGSAVAARAVVDSVLQATPEGSPAFGEALYWRAVLSESADQARRDYLRITIDYPLHARAADALLRLAQFEFASGDRDAARRHLEHLTLEYGDGATAAQGSYWLGRVLLEGGATLAACTAFARAKVKARGDDVELQGQITYYAQPCARTRADSIARADFASQAIADSVRADSIAKARKASGKATGRGATKGAVKKETNPPHAATGPTWSAQVAAYTQRDDAERLAKKLRARGYEVRVTADRPYRVRIGRFETRAAAVGLVDKLKRAKMSAIVVEAERP
jgi:cell division septation protein DedD